MRNLLGFEDGTAHVDGSDTSAMEANVWVGANSGQPDWAVSGTYQAIRTIRMTAEFWDRTRLNEQESMIRGHRAAGAPLGIQYGTDTPDLSANPDSHIARANPRTSAMTGRLLLHRGFNSANGFDQNDQLNKGLLLLCYQRCFEDGFIATQHRPDGEVLEEYSRPVGGGFFFVPSAPTRGEILSEPLDA